MRLKGVGAVQNGRTSAQVVALRADRVDLVLDVDLPRLLLRSARVPAVVALASARDITRRRGTLLGSGPA